MVLKMSAPSDKVDILDMFVRVANHWDLQDAVRLIQADESIEEQNSRQLSLS